MKTPLSVNRTYSIRTLTYSIALLSMLGALSACNDSNIDLMAATNQSNENKEQAYCVHHSKPFLYSLCSVAQDELLASDKVASDKKGDTQLSLRLFWKATDTNFIDPDSANSDGSRITETMSKNHGANTTPLYGFDNLVQQLPSDTTLKFAVNAGMYNTEFAPIGYTILQGKQIHSLNLKEGGGNFHLMPNGVLWWNKAGNVAITESHALSKMLKDKTAQPWYATQSGPMLIIDGNIHPKFNKGSSSIKFRNGVGVCQDNSIKFVNSNEPVNFYQFASLFKNTLNCSNALFLDGGIASALYAPEIGQQDEKNMGVMVGVVEK